VGQEKEGSIFNQPEFAASLLVFRDTLIQDLLQYLCDNQLLLKTVNQWISEGGKATSVGAPDAEFGQQPSTY